MDADTEPRGLAGRTVIVTGGGGPGIGGSLVRRFAATGAGVLVVDIDADAAEALAGEINAGGGRARVSAADVGTESGCRRMVEDALGAFGRVDVVVNSATAPEMGPVLGISEQGWQRTFDTNSTAVWRAARFAVPHMIESGGGVFVNISSNAALAAIPGAGAYGATKAAMLSITRQLAVELAPHGIRANAITPGLIGSPNVERLVEHHGRDRVNSALLGGIGRPDDIAGVAVFLASDDASYINGATITVDGGWYATNQLGGLGFNMTTAGT
jgi:NAD(P)-dependent dehydrogenase (short-subunit alcohol dehydrogenase family)